MEWFSTFFDFWKPAHFCWSDIFLGTQFQKISNFGGARAKFLFSKNHRDLKNKIFFWKFAETFLIHQRTISKNKIGRKVCLIFFYFPIMGKTVFDLYKVKINFFEFLFIFSFNKIKEYVPTCCRLKIPLNFVCLFVTLG